MPHAQTQQPSFSSACRLGNIPSCFGHTLIHDYHACGLPSFFIPSLLHAARQPRADGWRRHHHHHLLELEVLSQCESMHCKFDSLHISNVAKEWPAMRLRSACLAQGASALVVEISLHTINNILQGCIIPRVHASPCPRFWHVSFAYGWDGMGEHECPCVWMLSFAVLVSFFSFSVPKRMS